jgi:acyl-CoA dehydrogenase
METTMEPILTDEHIALRESVREFAARYCPPDQVRKWDDEQHFPVHVYEAMAELGYMGIAVDPEYGGSGGDVIAQEIMVEELYRAMQGSAEMWFNTSCFGGESVRAYGNEDQKRKILPGIVAGKLMFAISVTEPGGGTDVLGHMRTRAEKVDGGWLVNGRKIFTTAADIADYILLVTRSKPDAQLKRKSDGINVFLFPAKTDGISMKDIPKMSQRTLGHFEVTYDNVYIPDEYLLGEPHEGWRQLLHTLNNERILGAAFCLGCAQAALDDAVAYANVREAYGKPIGAFQAIAHHIANMAMAIEQARLMTLKAAWMQSRGLPCGMEATMAKVAASEAASMSSDLGMQILGGYGMALTTDMQRYWRDSRIMRLGPVSNEMGRNFIAMELGLPRSY